MNNLYDKILFLMLKNLCGEDQNTDENILQFKDFKIKFFLVVLSILCQSRRSNFTKNTMFKDLHFIIYMAFIHIFTSIICNVSFLLGTITIVKCTSYTDVVL